MANSYSNSHSALLQNKTQIDIGALPQLNPEGKLDVINTLTLKTGDSALLVRLGPNQLHAVMDLQDDHRNDPAHEGKNYTIYRSQEDYLKMMQDGVLFGLVINNRLAAMSGIAPIKDKNDLGRGEPWDDNGKYPLDLQQFMKSIISHPSLKDYHLGILDIFYKARVLESAKHPERPCLLLKTNNPIVQNFYENKKGWLEVARYRLPEADELDCQLEENEKDLVTYFIMIDEALAGLEKEALDITAYQNAEGTVPANENSRASFVQGYANA